MFAYDLKKEGSFRPSEKCKFKTHLCYKKHLYTKFESVPINYKQKVNVLQVAIFNLVISFTIYLSLLIYYFPVFARIQGYAIAAVGVKKNFLSDIPSCAK